MGDFHVLTVSPEGGGMRVVFHVPIPIQNNDAAKGYRLALSTDAPRDERGNVVSAVPDISVTEQDALNDGSLAEESRVFFWSPGLTATQIKQALQAKYTAYANAARQRIQARYKVWGMTEK